jgi:hypothetical protein
VKKALVTDFHKKEVTLLLLEVYRVEFLGDEERQDGGALLHFDGDEPARGGGDGEHVVDPGIKFVSITAKSSGTGCV